MSSAHELQVLKRHRGSRSGGPDYDSQQLRGRYVGSAVSVASSVLLLTVSFVLFAGFLAGFQEFSGSGSRPGVSGSSDQIHRPHSPVTWGAGCEDGELTVDQLLSMDRTDRFKFENCCGSSRPPAWSDISVSQALSGAVASPRISDSLDFLEADGAPGENHSTGQYRSCWEGWPMRCRALCLGYCTAPSTIGKGLGGNVARHDICFGPLGSTCPYDCTPMYTPDGEMRCLPGDSAYQGGLCKEVFERGPGNPGNGNRRNESWYKHKGSSTLPN
eukprot:COSAG02_NODE_1_length_108762_cov_456.708287_50_plen_273_part_00